ncbi:MAG: alpha/beta hydrolase family protein [Candidatus Poseidoniaceae archaeon]
MLTNLVANLLLQGPPKSTPPLDDASWPSYVRTGPRAAYRYHINRRSRSAPTVVAVHGWTSGTAHARNRTQVLADKGWNVLLLESLGHGTSTYADAWTAHCVLECLEDLLDALGDGSLGVDSTDLFLHGHSLGAYVVLRALQGRHGQKVRAVLLESPMTSYSPIFTEAIRGLRWPQWIPGFQRRLEHRLMSRWNAMHPGVSITAMSQVDVPAWGVPHVPTFVMQADPDTRLGPEQLDNLLACVPEDLIDVWTSTTLRHSGTSAHPERDEAMLNWLEMKGFTLHC